MLSIELQASLDHIQRFSDNILTGSQPFTNAKEILKQVEHIKKVVERDLGLAEGRGRKNQEFYIENHQGV